MELKYVENKINLHNVENEVMDPSKVESEYVENQIDIHDQKIDMNLHNTEITDNSIDSITKKTYSCNQCEKHFARNGHLKSHMKTHTHIVVFLLSNVQ